MTSTSSASSLPPAATTPSWALPAENFLSGLGTDLGNLVSRFEAGLEWAGTEVSDFEKLLVAQLPDFNDAVQSILAAAAAATEAIVPNLSAIVAAAQAVAGFIIALFEHTGQPQPGGGQAAV